MKIVYRISIILNILFAGYILIRGSELLMRDYLEENASPKQETVIDVEMDTDAVSTTEHITCDTIYTISEYDLSTGRQEVYQELLPASFIGMNRNRLMEWIDDYNGHASLEDLEKGFVSMELLSFSQQEIRVRKRIESEKNPMQTEEIIRPQQLITEETEYTVSGNGICYGCILAQDGLLTVYDGGRRHVILYTDISLFDLPQQQQQEILDGKEVYSEQELYNLLESYSS